MKEAPPARGHLRRLSDEEIELWLTVTRSVQRRPGSRAPEPDRAKTEKRAKTEAPAAMPAAKPSPQTPPSHPSLAPLERRARQRLARGRLAVGAAIDLHGMRQHEAPAALHGFLSRAQRDGAKIALVVTGKGDSRPVEGFAAGGVLRRTVPHWLGAPEWRGIVLGFEEASRPHGGAGAL